MVAEWVRTVSDLRFVAAKCAVPDGVFDLIRDYADKRLFAPPEEEEEPEKWGADREEDNAKVAGTGAEVESAQVI